MGSVYHSQKFFAPLRVVGDMDLSHCLIMLPLTRAQYPGDIPTKSNAEYYAQWTTPGGLCISEGTIPSFMAGNLHEVHGIYTSEHIQEWKLVTDAVPAKGGFIFCQLGHEVTNASVAPHTNWMPNRFTPTDPILTGIAKEMSLTEITATVSEHVHTLSIAYIVLAQPKADLFFSEPSKLANLHAAVEKGELELKRGDSVGRLLAGFEGNDEVACSEGVYVEGNCFAGVEGGMVDATFGWAFIGNLDLVEGRELGIGRLGTFYGGGEVGYVDYPHTEEL